MMAKWRGLLVLAGVLMLAGCASRGARVDAPGVLEDPESLAAARAQQATREAWLRTQAEWSFEGRVAVSQGERGGSGRLDWQQRDDGFVAQLSAPVTRQSWRLSADGHGARLEGLEGGTRQGPDADQLLREATGWEIPVRTLADWARGVVVQGEPIYGSDGRLQTLDQAGWNIRYTEWRAGEAGSPAMPRRVEAQRGPARVRLVVDQWSFGSAP